VARNRIKILKLSFSRRARLSFRRQDRLTRVCRKRPSLCPDRNCQEYAGAEEKRY